MKPTFSNAVSLPRTWTNQPPKLANKWLWYSHHSNFRSLTNRASALVLCHSGTTQRPSLTDQSNILNFLYHQVLVVSFSLPLVHEVSGTQKHKHFQGSTLTLIFPLKPSRIQFIKIKTAPGLVCIIVIVFIRGIHWIHQHVLKGATRVCMQAAIAERPHNWCFYRRYLLTVVWVSQEE